jgi:hypothetical protein
VDIAAATKGVVAQIERLPEVLTHGSVAEVKAVLKGFVATVEYNPETRKARVGFYPLERSEPARAILGFSAPESARISVVAGAGYSHQKKIFPPIQAEEIRFEYKGKALVPVFS